MPVPIDMPYPPCLRCPRQARRRGVCFAHYQQLRLRVAAGLATWEQLQAAGLCRAAGRSPWREGRKWLRR
jgi:hypothetical protein